MDDFDLDIDNYDLEDILDLFHLNYKFDKESMKKAKIIALKTHPDKSGLSKDFFLFFMKAYKMLEAIYEYRFKKEQCAKNQKYSVEVDNENKQLLKKLDGKNPKEFNKWFNEMFDKVKVKDEDLDTGYGSWFKSNNDMNDEVVKNKRDMEEAFYRKKQQSRSLVLHKEVRDVRSTGGYNLTREKPEQYTSDMFSNLPFQDLKQAHTETVIPVTKEDYLSKPRFENVESYVRYREQNRPDMVSLDQSKKMLKNRNMQK